MKRKECLLTFKSTSAALKAESALARAKVPCTVVPTPVEINADCGISLLLDRGLSNRASAELDSLESMEYRMVCPFERKRPGREGGG